MLKAIKIDAILKTAQENRHEDVAIGKDTVAYTDINGIVNVQSWDDYLDWDLVEIPIVQSTISRNTIVKALKVSSNLMEHLDANPDTPDGELLRALHGVPLKLNTKVLSFFAEPESDVLEMLQQLSVVSSLEALSDLVIMCDSEVLQISEEEELMRVINCIVHKPVSRARVKNILNFITQLNIK